MSFAKLIATALVVGLIIIDAPCLMGQDSEAPQSLQEVRRYRENLKKMKVSFTSTYTRNDKASPFVRDVTIWTDLVRCRADVRRSNGNGSQYREVTCLNCIQPGTGILWGDNPVNGDGVRALTITPIPKNASDAKLAYPAAIDPRLLGLIAKDAGNIRMESIDDFLPKSSGKYTASAEKIDGMLCERVKYTGENNTRMEWLIAKNCGPSLLSSEFLSGSGDSEYKISIRCNLDQYGPNKIWYPRTIQFSRSRGGSILAEERVEIKELTDSLDSIDRVFSLEGMGIPKGVIVTGANSAGYAVWDGQSLVDEQTGKAVELRRPASGRKSSYFYAAIGCGSLAVAFLAYTLMRSRSRKVAADLKA